MIPVEAHMDEVAARWVDALRSYEGNEPLRTEVEQLVNDFFARRPGLERTPVAERFITALSLDRAVTARAGHPATPQTPNAA